MKFELTILGVSAATPAHGRFPAAQILRVHQHFFLIDCGEGAQMRMSEFDIPRHKIQQIFISHLHGDHIFGLPGLLYSFALNGRQQPLDVFSPPGLEAMIIPLLPPAGQMGFPIHFHAIDTSSASIIFENNDLIVQAIPLRHRTPTAGFVFREKPPLRNIRPEKIEEYGLSIPQIKAVKAGQNLWLDDGRCLLNEELTLQQAQMRSFAYISDTMYDESLLPYIQEVDLLFHETTFCHDLLENAELTMHTTAWQAAQIARLARVKTLITGHYSSRYENTEAILEEAKSVFPDTVPGIEGHTYEVLQIRP
jgi:ribonuclease Z